MHDVETYLPAEDLHVVAKLAADRLCCCVRHIWCRSSSKNRSRERDDDASTRKKPTQNNSSQFLTALQLCHKVRMRSVGGRPTTISESQIRGNDARYNGRRVFKVLLLGDSDVGKSSMLRRFIDDHFSHTTPTIGVDMKMRDVVVDGVQLKLQIWDTAGQERFRVITRAYYAGADGVLVMYDGNQSETFKSLPYWFEQIADNAPSAVMKLLVCCQSDKMLPPGDPARVVRVGAASCCLCAC